MTGLGAVLVGVGAWHALFIASNREDHARGMHALIWGSAFVNAGSVK